VNLFVTSIVYYERRTCIILYIITEPESTTAKSFLKLQTPEPAVSLKCVMTDIIRDWVKTIIVRLKVDESIKNYNKAW